MTLREELTKPDLEFPELYKALIAGLSDAGEFDLLDRPIVTLNSLVFMGGLIGVRFPLVPETPIDQYYPQLQKDVYQWAFELAKSKEFQETFTFNTGPVVIAQFMPICIKKYEAPEMQYAPDLPIEPARFEFAIDWAFGFLHSNTYNMPFVKGEYFRDLNQAPKEYQSKITAGV